MGSIHINADAGAFADTVLFPGDPLRAKYIAGKFFEGAEQVTDVRNILGFTGEYKGRRISVMGSGMGIPSASIYAKELITEYGVKEIVRIGSCGAVSKDVQLRDVVIGMGASTDSNVNRIRFGGYDYAAIADFGLLGLALLRLFTDFGNFCLFSTCIALFGVWSCFLLGLCLALAAACVINIHMLTAHLPAGHTQACVCQYCSPHQAGGIREEPW